MRTVDLWVNALSVKAARHFANQQGNAGIAEFFQSDYEKGSPLESLVADMDANGIDTGVLAGALSDPATESLAQSAGASGGRFALAAVVDDPEHPVAAVGALRRLAAHRALCLVRVTPLVRQYPLNHRLYYPLYAACCELGLPVSINVGVPGPRVRSACQHPELLEDVLIDFPDLVVIGAHMGHPYESLLIQFMLKWPQLYLSNSAYSAKYLDPELVRFMNSSRGRGRVLFASDHPFLSLARAAADARAVALDDESMAAFMGTSATALLALDERVGPIGAR